MAYTHDLKSCAERHEGSTPSSPTKQSGATANRRGGEKWSRRSRRKLPPQALRARSSVVEHLFYTQGVPGPNPGARTKNGSEACPAPNARRDRM
ncbi:MAG: hypothetical protein UX60_C0005G0002 [Berkelbacteria bacterium GW2011_GWA2_46_7]|uniref:Uncharacterized protein n=1 Tax=Berkelbacteria bacterium GW2011_GWA2_46_7 TaxID=1618335 RepID=A0A0G1QHJ6_9BACT|nr:MAG: hypothetical protein UX60_C0005G0002 [Berkelbacteria bacterium GW2011_GWA2_46_7]